MQPGEGPGLLSSAAWAQFDTAGGDGSPDSGNGMGVNTTINIEPGLALQIVNGGIRLPDDIAKANPQ